MQIKRLVLKLYKRLMLSNIQSVDWSPQSHLMVILGSNGSGKSSILEELTPLPSATHKNFALGGLKEIWIQHKEREYHLISRYDGGTGRHSFLVGDEDLNPGGTVAVQKQLVQEHFKLTRDIHEVLIDIKQFTSMSTKERREWLTLMSPMDLAFGFDQYNKLRGLHRDQVGVIKHITKRMTLENVDLPDDAELNRQRQGLDDLTHRLNGLFQSKGGELKAQFHSNQSALQQLVGMVSKGKDLLTHYPTLLGDNTTTTRPGFLEQVGHFNQSVKSHETMLDHFMHELHEVEQQQPSNEEALTDEQLAQLRLGIAQLKGEAEAQRAVVGQYRGQFPLPSLDYAHTQLSKLDSLFERWLELLKTFPENADGRFNPQQGRSQQEALATHKREYSRLEQQQIQWAQRLSQIKGCQSVVCPQCTHTFQPGVDLMDVRRLEGQLEQVGTELERLAGVIKVLTHYVEEFQTYSSFVFRFRGVADDYADFAELWHYCAEHRVMFATPLTFVTDALGWHQAMTARIKAAHAQERLEREERKLAIAEAFDRDAVGFMATKKKRLEGQIEELTHQLNAERRHTRAYRQSGEAVDALESQIRQLLKDFTTFYEAVAQQIKYLVQQGIDAEIRALQYQMSEARTQLSKLEMREHTLKSLEVEHRHAVEIHHDLGIMSKALSPTDGVLGRYLMGFMQALVGLMNDVIGEIWTHPLEVLPSKVDSDELSYLFPLNVNDGAVIAPDIAMGSAGQRDVVNFTFKIMLMKFLGLENYPLPLDEFGAAFDEAHRGNMVPFLLQLVDLGTFNQLFFVSHYASTHGAFNQSEFVVVDAANITVPQVYNQNVVFT